MQNDDRLFHCGDVAHGVYGGSGLCRSPHQYGVPHIYSDTLEGLFFGFGYATAQDRLFQIEMFRRTFWGRLSEVLGEKLLPFDQGNRRDNLSLTEIKRQVEGLSPQVQTVMKTYAAGINAYIAEAVVDPENKLPKEFKDLGFTSAPWSSEDVAANFLSVMGFFMDVSAELANASMMKFLVEKHGPQKGQIIFDDWCWGYDPESPTTIHRRFTLPRGKAVQQRAGLNNPVMKTALKTAFLAETALAREQAQGRFFMKWTGYGHPASYAVTVAPSKSSTGNSEIMGGPQFGFEFPSAVYEVGLHGAGIDVVGSTLTGYPFVMFGHNRRAAFSSTAGIDNIEDIYAEKLNPDNPRQYWYQGAWRDMEVRSHTFHIKGKAEPVVKEDLYTVHGPIFFVDAAHNVAFSKHLSCKSRFMQGLSSFFDLMNAETVPEFYRAARRRKATCPSTISLPTPTGTSPITTWAFIPFDPQGTISACRRPVPVNMNGRDFCPRRKTPMRPIPKTAFWSTGIINPLPAGATGT